MIKHNIKKIFKKIGLFNTISTKYLKKLSIDEIFSRVLHNCHRLEKSYYNKHYEEKFNYYHEIKEETSRMIEELNNRKVIKNKDVIEWATIIIDNYEKLEKAFIIPNSCYSPPIEDTFIKEFINHSKNRRSCRTWSDSQPNNDKISEIAFYAIEAARWAPNSGNRQAWRFAIITDQGVKNMFKGLKEPHCYNAPGLIFVGIDSRSYRAANHLKDCRFIDAGACIMQMIMALHAGGYGSCWNHLSWGLINSRKTNQKIWNDIANQLNIPKYIDPMALLAFGIPQYLPPTPPRIELNSTIMFVK